MVAAGASGRSTVTTTFAIRTLGFDSDGSRCRGVLYRPARPATPPVVVMGPDFAAERTFGYPRVAAQLAAAGYATFAFDYRGFGASEGRPRGVVAPERQVADWHAAVDRIRRVDGVDARRVALWGFGLGGGHAVRVAAESRRVSAAIAVAPLLDGWVLVRSRSPRYLSRAAVATVRDRLGARIGRPSTVPVVAGPHSHDGDAYLDRVPRDSDWRNATPARSLLAVGRYRPLRYAADVDCPLLVLTAGDDALVPPEQGERAADRAPEATLVRLPVAHFDIFRDRVIEEAVGHQVAFLDRALSDPQR
jgi:alpha-beta hydrolase superfamily lysophospholipase